MDKNYIKENGILELYLLGELSDAENSQVEGLLADDKELHAEYKEIEESLESLAFENAVKPNNNVKDKIMSDISSETKKTASAFPFYKYAASIAAVLFLLSSVFMYNKWQTTEKEFEAQKEQTDQLNNRLLALEKEFTESKYWMDQINTPEVDKYLLKGNSNSPTSNAIVYVNDKAKKVIINCSGLKELGENQDYQMWADVDGEMINMGVLTKNKNMLALTYIDNAESFNITIEPLGGSKSPTVKNLISNIYI